MLAVCLLAWGYGLRHAVDADHIAAIDNVSRKLLQQNKQSFTTGAWFSLGHSTIVVLASIGVALAIKEFSNDMNWMQDVGGAMFPQPSCSCLLSLIL